MSRLEGPRRSFAAERVERRGDGALERLEDIVARRKGDLEIELAELELAVGPQILVPKACGDLVVAAEPGDHQRLFEELRRLHQREEAAGLKAHRHEEVASAFRGGLAHVRRPDVDEPLLVHEPPDRGDDRRREAQVPLHRLAAQVQVAVPQP